MHACKRLASGRLSVRPARLLADWPLLMSFKRPPNLYGDRQSQLQPIDATDVRRRTGSEWVRRWVRLLRLMRAHHGSQKRAKKSHAEVLLSDF